MRLLNYFVVNQGFVKMGFWRKLRLERGFYDGLAALKRRCMLASLRTRVVMIGCFKPPLTPHPSLLTPHPSLLTLRVQFLIHRIHTLILRHNSLHCRHIFHIVVTKRVFYHLRYLAVCLGVLILAHVCHHYLIVVCR